MDLFLSWGGQASKELASLLHEFLPVVVQECIPWMSSNDILAGQPWDAELEGALKRSQFGVLCLTPENRGNAYMHYEAGAIANQVGLQNKVCPLLLGLTPEQLGQPLGRFQAKVADRKGIWELVLSLAGVAKRPLALPLLQKSLDGQWANLEKSIEAIPLSSSLRADRPSGDILNEILQHVRAFAASRPPEPRPPSTASIPRVKAPPQALIRVYGPNLVGRIYRMVEGGFQWSLEDTKQKAVIAAGEAPTQADAQAATDDAGGPSPGSWTLE